MCKHRKRARCGQPGSNFILKLLAKLTFQPSVFPVCNIAGIFTFSDIMERNGFKTFLQQILHIMRLWAKSRHTCRIIVMVLGLIIINIVQYCGTLLSVFIYFLFYFDSPASCVTVFCFDREELSHVGDQLYSLLFLISSLPSCVFSPLSSSFCCWFICVSSLVFPIFRFLVSYNI